MVQRTRGKCENNYKTDIVRYRFKAFKARRSVELHRRVVDGLLPVFSLHGMMVISSLNSYLHFAGREGEIWLIKKI